MASYITDLGTDNFTNIISFKHEKAIKTKKKQEEAREKETKISEKSKEGARKEKAR